MMTNEEKKKQLAALYRFINALGARKIIEKHGETIEISIMVDSESSLAALKAIEEKISSLHTKVGRPKARPPTIDSPAFKTIAQYNQSLIGYDEAVALLECDLKKSSSSAEKYLNRYKDYVKKESENIVKSFYLLKSQSEKNK